MKTFAPITTLLAIASTALGSPVPEPAVEGTLEKRADQYFSFWTNVNFQGDKGQVKNPPAFKCYDMVSPYQDSVSSAGPTSGLVCTLFENFSCKGASVTLRNPGVSDLRSVNFNDRASSYQCAPA